MKVIKRILAGILVVLAVGGISSFSSIKAKGNQSPSEIEIVEVEVRAPEAQPILVSETIETSAMPEPTPEPKFYYSKFIRVLVAQSEKDKIEALLLEYDEEIKMMAKIIIEEAERSKIPLAHKAAVVWVILNRYDDGEWGDSLKHIMTAPHQFAWNSKADLTYEWLARDVFTRWLLEKEGHALVGRTIPPDWYFFAGWSDGLNHFRKTYKGKKTYWDWSLPDPYKDLPYPDDLSVIIEMFAEEQKCSSVNTNLN